MGVGGVPDVVRSDAEGEGRCGSGVDGATGALDLAHYGS